VKLDNLLQKIISILFACLFFLVPLFFTSVNSELFEFNKIILVYLFAILIASAWIGRMVLQRRRIFRRTFFDIPLLLFLISQFASTLLSIDPHTSIFGYYSRFNGGLLSTICYLLLYWACVSNCEVKDVHKVVKVSLISAAIVSIYGILEHFGHSFSCLMFQGNFNVDCWIQRVQERVFATLGQPNWLAAYLVILIPVAWAKMLDAKKKIVFALYCLLSTVYFLCLIFTGSRSGFLGLCLSAIVFWLTIILTHRSQIKSLTKPLILATFYLLLATIIFGSPFPQINKYLSLRSIKSSFTPLGSDSFTPPVTNQQTDTQIATGGTESSIIRKIVWKGAIDIFKHSPLFGSGVETFAYSYYNFRPIEHNLVTEWDFLYNKAHNEYLNYLATTGALGTITYLGFIISFIFFVSRIIPNKPNCSEFPIIRAHSDKIRINSGEELGETPLANRILIVALFTGWLSILVTNFFGFSVVVTSLYFFLIPAFAIVLSKDSHLTPTSRSTSLPAVASAKAGHLPLLLPFVPLLLTTYYLLSTTINYWRADYFYSRAQKLTKQSNYPDAYQNLYQAKSLFPNEPVYLGDIATVTANLALMSNAQKDASAKSDLAAATGELIQLAINYSDQAKYISPKNLNVLKTRVRVFYTLSLIEPDYLNGAIEAMLEATALAPTDPKLVYNLGLLYAKNDDSKLAIQTIEKAVQLKPNYIDARNALVLFYEDAGEKDKALEQLQMLLKLAPENASEFGKQIDKLK